MEAALDFSPPKIHESERYEFVRKIGSGGFGEARLMRDKLSGESVAIKYLERGDKIDEKVQREIINHRSLRHPNIIAFKEVILTPTHLAIVMEYAPGGELFERIRKAGKLCEDEARFFFQQLISGVSYCHKMEICHRDLKLENLLLDGNPIPRLQICDFGYSKSSVFNSLPRSTVGTPAYIAPEVLQKKEYDGKVADVWSCGVTLYVMLFGTYPFVDPENPNNIYQMFQRILTLAYSIPKDANLSRECLHLISRIFVLDAKERITIPEIKKHEWYLKNLPEELRAENEMEEKQPLGGQYSDHEPMQSNETIIQIVEEASIPDPNFADAPTMDLEMGTDSDEDDDDWLVDSSGELVTITSMQRGI